MIRRTMALLLCLVLAGSFVSGARAGQMTITDIGEAEDLYLFKKDFGDSGIQLMIPLPYIKSVLIENGEELTQMAFLTEDGIAKPFFVISGIKLPSNPPKELKEMGWQDFKPIFQPTVQDTTGYEQEYLRDYVDGLPGMRVTFEGDTSGRHLVGIRDGWLVAVSTIPGGEATDLEGTQRYENAIFTYVLRSYDHPPEVTRIDLHDSGLSLTLPEGMSALEDRYDEYEDQEYVVYFIHPPEDAAVMLLSLITIRKDEFQGKRLQELDPDTLNRELGRLVTGVGELDASWLRADSEFPLLLIHEVGAGDGRQKNSDVYTMALMKDGWLFATTYIDGGIRPLEEMLTFQMNCMRSMLAGDGKTPSFEPEVIRVGTLNGVLELHIPYGYNPVARGENDYLIFDMRSPDKAYLAAFETDEEWAGVTAASQRAALEENIPAIEEGIGEAVTVEILEKGPLDEPTLLLTTESRNFTMAYFIKDGCSVHLGMQTQVTPVTQEEVDRLPELLRYGKK